MNRRRVRALATLALLAAGCTREISSQEPSTTTTTLTPTTTLPTPTTSVTTPPTAITVAPTSTTIATTTTLAPTTAPPVPTDIVGVAIAGNAGGVGPDLTDSFSEAVRNEDGTCSGWTGRNVPAPWTDGLVSGAPFVILPPDGHDIIAEGALGTSTFANVGTTTEQWMCSFPFSFTMMGSPDEFMIKVGNLDPWLMRRDPTQPDRYIGSVNTVASEEYFPQCASAPPAAVTTWSSVGKYWSQGIPALCDAGLRISRIERPCRGPSEGSDYVVKVVRAADPNDVYEDAGGVKVDVATIVPGTEVIVLVATGRPCG